MRNVTAKAVSFGSTTSWLNEYSNRVGGGSARPSVQALLDQYADNSWVYACISLIQTKAAGVPLKVYRTNSTTGKPEEIPNHALQRLLETVNPMMNGYDLQEATNGYLELTGLCYWLPDAEVSGLPTELYTLIPSFVTPKWNEQGLIGYEYRPNGKLIKTFKPDELVVFRKWNPTNPFDGLAPGIPTREVSRMILSSDRFNAAFIENGATPGGFLTSERTLLEEAKRIILEGWNKLYRGVRNVNKTAILDGGLKWQATGATHSDMQFTELHSKSIRALLAGYRVQPVMLGIHDDSNYSNAKEQRRAFWVDSMVPRLKKIESVINEKLAPRFGSDIWVAHDLTGIEDLQEDQLAKAQRDEIHVRQGIKTINEVRDELNLPAVPWGNKPPQPANPFGLPLRGDDDEPIEDEEEEEDDEKTALPKPRAPEMSIAEKGVIRRTMLWHRFKGHTEAMERRWYPTLRKLFSSQEREVIENVRANWQKTATNCRLAEFKTIKQDVSVFLFERGEARKVFQKEGRRLIQIAFAAAAEREVNDWNLPQFDVINPKTVEWIQNKAFRFANEVNTTTEDALRHELEEAIKAGDTIKDVAKRIEGVFTDAKRSRTEMIARTEVISASNKGAMTAYEESGVVSGVEWVSSRDGLVRDGHQIDGEEVPLNSTFSNGLKFPGDPSGDAGNVINCFLPGTQVEGSFIAGVRSEYFGPAIDIVTRGGRTLSLTPNHPVLTPNGFVPAGQLRASDNLVSYGGVVSRGAAIPNIHEENGPASIEDVFDSLRVRLLSLRRHLRPDDFHGDARWVVGEVDIVRPDGALSFELPAPSLELVEDGVLVSEGMRPALPAGQGALLHRRHEIVASSPSLPSGSHLTGDIASLHASPLYPLRIGSASKLDSMLLEVGAESRSSDSRSIGNALERFSGQIGLDEIVEIRNREFRGHVYDLQSVSGLLIAGGIISHNCRCTTAPVVRKESA